MTHDTSSRSKLITGTRISYQKRGENGTCSIASTFLVRDSDTSNLEGELGLCAMGLKAVI